MITYLESSVFDSPAQTLINTVNTEGVMGKGIAKEFKRRFPIMFREYSNLCRCGALSPGKLHIWRDDQRWVLNFPTKVSWRNPSKLSYIEDGLKKFLESYGDLGITSASFPPLGCGNGGLDWNEVRPLMESYLSKVGIPIYIHNVHVKSDFVPEHRQPQNTPTNFSEFISDLTSTIQSNDGDFNTKTSHYSVKMLDDNSLHISLQNGKIEKINSEIIEEAWLRLRDRLLYFDSFPDERSRKLKSYLFPIIAKLRYVESVDVRTEDGSFSKANGFYINRDRRADYKTADPIQGHQTCLFP